MSKLFLAKSLIMGIIISIKQKIKSLTVDKCPKTMDKKVK
jgi:hypothetical protein